MKKTFSAMRACPKKEREALSFVVNVLSDREFHAHIPLSVREGYDKEKTKMRKRRFIVLAFTLLGCVQAFGQEVRKEVSVGFRVGKGTLDTAYMDNAARLSEIVSFIEEIKRDTTFELVGVSFHGSASPEGSIVINRKLAEERRRNLEAYVRARVELDDGVVSRGEGVTAWETLARLVEASDMPHKEEAVDVLRNVPEATYDEQGRLVDSKKKHLMELQYGRTWHYMLKHFFPQARNACVVFVTVRMKPVTPPEPEPETPVAPPAEPVAPTPPPAEPAPAPEPRKPFYMALKTNLLYDVAAVPNVGVEFYLGKNWSATGSWMYGWWKKERRERFWRIYGGEVAVRKWFGKKAEEKPLTGHHLGVYGQLFTYDFEWGGTGYMGGKPGESLWNTPNYAAGVEYGYSLPVGRRLNFDFVIGAGYWGGKYYTYEPLDGHYVWKSTKNRHWVGPTKAEVSLVWLLGRGNTNNTKGGKK